MGTSMNVEKDVGKNMSRPKKTDERRNVLEIVMYVFLALEASCNFVLVLPRSDEACEGEYLLPASSNEYCWLKTI